jgi:hypothetical protein
MLILTIFYDAVSTKPVQTGRGSHSASCTYWVSGLLPGVKRPDRGANQPPSSTPRLKSRAIPLPFLWAFMACPRPNFTFILSTADVS